MVEKTTKALYISTAEARHTKPLLQAIIEESGGTLRETLSKDKYDLKWHASNVEDEELLESLKNKKHISSRFPGIKGLAHKDYYIKINKIGRAINEAAFNFIPNQFLFPQDEEKFKQYHKSCKQGAVFIAKPVASSEGNSILLFKELADLPSMLSREMVVQHYIHNPLLVDGYKFDLRVYVVIVGTDGHSGEDGWVPVSSGSGLKAFMCTEGLARFCTEPYQKPTKENFKEFYMHLTNYSINKHSETYVESENILGPNNASKRTITSLMKTLNAKGIDTGKLKERIMETCSNAMSIFGPLIQHQVSVATNGKPIEGKYFQVLGFDILPDEDLNCYLLEINDHPSLEIFLEKVFMGGGTGLKSLSQIDLYVKKTVVGDAIMLARKKKSKVAEIEHFNSLQQITFNDDAQIVHDCLMRMREIYYSIAPVKGKLNITSSNFEKLPQKSAFLKASGITTVDLSLNFQRAGSGQKFLEFIDFFWVLYKTMEKVEKQGAGSGEISQFVQLLSE